VKLGSLWQKSETLLSNPQIPLLFDELYALREEATALNRDLILWQKAQSDNFRPTKVGYVSPSPDQLSLGAGSWPGQVDTYVDLYVAGVWNVSRVARCFLINSIVRLSNILDPTSDHRQYHQDVRELVGDIFASIPYHLTEDLGAFVAQGGANPEIANPGRPVGGLMLLHPVYIASQLPVVPPEMQEYMRKCLAWIGKYMGIGQACLLAKVIPLPPLSSLLMVIFSWVAWDTSSPAELALTCIGSTNRGPVFCLWMYACVGGATYLIE
jgi:hypothetical protein